MATILQRLVQLGRTHLNDFLGQNILIRFQLVSDNFTEYDGFYFDDLRIDYINSTGVGIQKPDASTMFLSPAMPNPATSQATISYANATNNSTLMLYNIYGQLVWEKSLTEPFGKILIPLHQLASGMYSYFIQMNDGSVSKSLKLVKN